MQILAREQSFDLPDLNGVKGLSSAFCRENLMATQTWLQERTLLHRGFGQPWSGLLNVALLFGAGQLVWYVLFAPIGIFKLYTPNVGLAFVISCLMVIHWFNDVADFSPFSRDYLRKTSPLLKGVTLSALLILVALFIMLVVYNNGIGRFGASFFSGDALLASEGLGQYAQTARENAYYAQIMMNTAIIFFTILWTIGFGSAPWHKSERTLAAFSTIILGLLLGVVGFVMLYYPHIAYQFYPAQIFMAVEPWWIGVAMTQSSLFHFGWMVPALVLLYWIGMLWEGAPFRSIQNPWLRGIATLIFVVVLGIGIEFAANAVMDWYWGVEAYEGGSTIEQPAWRWNHVAELFMMMALAGGILFHYFDNWPQSLPLPLRAVIRTLIAVCGGLLIAAIYWEYGPYFLGTVYGLGQENDTSNAWTIMMLVLLNLHMLCFDGWPLRKLAPSATK